MLAFVYYRVLPLLHNQTKKTMEAIAKHVLHTPGPWVAMHEKSQDQYSVYGPIPDNKRWEPRLAKVQYNAGNDVSKEQTEANARLIAAAPEMFEALRYACHEFITTTNLGAPSDTKHWYNRAKDALRSAGYFD